MPDKVVIKPGMVLTVNDIDYRILGMQDGIVCTCVMNIEHLDFVWFNDSDIDSGVRTKNWKIRESEDSHTVISQQELSDISWARFEKNRKAMYTIQSHYGPLYKHLKYDRNDHYATKVREEYGYTKPVFWRLVRRWLQSGFDDASLVDQRTLKSFKDRYEYVDGHIRKDIAGKQRVSDSDMANMNKYFKAYISQKYTSMKGAYLDMCNEYYRERRVEGDTTIFGTIDDCPSYQQFVRYCNNHLTPEQKDSISMKKREIRNNKRILRSSSMTEARYAGQIAEVDEMDDPVSLVSETDPEQTISRPNTYMMIDIKSRVILAVGIAFNQNAYVGLSNMLINLAEDKVEYCKKYGIEIQPEWWPSGIIPEKIRADRGSDFKGNDFREVCIKVGIERNLEPPATGSLKGIIENSFNVIQKDERELFQNIGLITKEYDSGHHEKAMLNLYEFTRVFLTLVIKHNTRAMSKYPMSADMIRKGIQPIPYKLWEYFSQTVQSPMPIANKDAFLISLMKEGKASVDRQGIHFLKRTYFPVVNDAVLETMMYENQSKKTYIDIRYDPRLMNNIYVIRGGRMIVLEMSHNKPENNGFFNLSEQEVKELNDKHNKIIREGRKYNRTVDADTRVFAQTAIRNSYKDTLPSATKIRENRKAEKSKAAQQNYSIGERLGINTDSETPSDTPAIEESELKQPAPDRDDSKSEESIIDEFNELMGGDDE